MAVTSVQFSDHFVCLSHDARVLLLLRCSPLASAGALGMLLYGSDPLEVATPNMTDYITLQDANTLLNLLAKGSVSVATDTGLPVRHLPPMFWDGPSKCDLNKKRSILFRPGLLPPCFWASTSVSLQPMRRLCRRSTVTLRLY